MGIRIHKVLGYGIQNYIPDQYQIKLNRSELTYDDFEMYLSDKIKGIPTENVLDNDNNFYYFTLLQEIKEYKKTIHYSNLYYDFVKTGGECDEPNQLPTIIFTLPWNHWSRYDDAIDYYDNEFIDNVKLLNRPIYPYDTYIDIRTNKLVNNDYILIKRHIEDKNLPNEKLLSEFKLSSIEEFDKYIIPKINPSIIITAKFLNIIDNSDDLNCLRPMIYTYWS